ncbi:MAG: hypothetical protein ACE5Q6_01725 [Dehalococcoidia bacterium]
MAEWERMQESLPIDQQDFTGAVASTDEDPVCIFVVAWLILSVIVNLALLFGYVYQSGIIDIQKPRQRPLALVGVPGDTIRLDVYEGESVGGQWSSHDGIYLELSSEELDYRNVVTILAPGMDDDGCSGDDCSDSFSIKSSFVVPSLPQEGPWVLSGIFSGGIRYPAVRLNARVKAVIKVPVNLTIIPPGQGITSGKKERDRAWSIFWIVLGVDLALLVPGIMFFWLISGYIDVPKLRNRPLELVGVPWDTIKLRLFKGNSYGGLWGSDGIQLRVSNQESGFTAVVPVLPSKPMPASDQQEEESSAPFSVNGTLLVPEIPQGGTRIVSGVLSGTIKFPRFQSDNSGRKHSVDVPVRLKIVPRGKGTTSSQRGRRAWGTFWLVTGAAAALLALEILLVLN